MKQFLLRYYIVLSVILLGGYGQLFAHQAVAHPVFSAKKTVSPQEGYYTISMEDYAALINYTALHFEKQNDKTEFSDNEEEEEELSIHNLPFFKKFIALNKHFSNSYYSHAPVLFYKNLTQRLPYSRPFHSLSSKQYILFRVFRI